MAFMGQLDSENNLTPACPEHSYAWSCSEQEQTASIERFVQWRINDQGAARVLYSVAPADVPGYEHYEPDPDHPAIDWEDSAWLVLVGEAINVYVLWRTEDLAFELYG
jgi:hypothetical protein